MDASWCVKGRNTLGGEIQPSSAGAQFPVIQRLAVFWLGRYVVTLGFPIPDADHPRWQDRPRDSSSLRQAILASAGVEEIHLAMPNIHHIPVDLEPFGLENRNEVFVATSEPYGLIEATLRRG
jgi:hypothetical protein